jgi:hypothetical protein
MQPILVMDRQREREREREREIDTEKSYHVPLLSAS